MQRKTRPNGARRKKVPLEERRFRVFKAWSEGQRNIDIAATEGVNPGQVTRDLDHVLGQLHNRNLEDADRHRLEMLGKIAHGEAELLAAWERSKRPRERRKGKNVEEGQQTGSGESQVRGKVRKEGEKVTENRDGNPRFWERLESLWRLRCNLLGLLQSTVTLELAQRLEALIQRAKEHGHEIP